MTKQFKPPPYPRSLTRADLQRLYPQLYRQIEEILDRDGVTVHNNFWINYSGKYRYPNGRDRNFSLSSCLEFIQANGYKIDFQISTY